MEQEGPSFWVDIKKYEDTLARDPNSYCFAPLSELYRKLGLLDDALNVAKRGCEIHPDYVGGHMALGRALFEKGMKEESRIALEKVVRVTPDNLLAQRVLSQIYIDTGDIAAAEKSLQAILSQNPDDMESKILLNSLARSTGAISQPSPEAQGLAVVGRGEETGKRDDELFPVDDAEEPIDLEDAEILEEFAEEEDEEDVFIYSEQDGKSDPNSFLSGGGEGEDPLNTVTLAELYVSQGFLKRALTIYRELLESDPDNMELKNRLFGLKQESDKDEAIARQHSLELDTFATEYAEPAAAPFVPGLPPTGPEGGSSASEVLTSGGSPSAGAEGNVVHTLERWLENIRRRR
jgi:tetratricopeptide (TPR) repeat protein